MREVETITSLRSACGWLPPVSPVLPPCGTMATPASAQMRTMAATSSVRLGPQHGRHRALPVVAPALAVGGDVGRVLDDTGRADGGTQTVDDGTRNGRRRAEGCCHEAGLACKSGAHAA